MPERDQVVERRTAVPESQPRPLGYYALLIGLYNALYGVFLLLYRGRRPRLEQIGALDLAMLSMATLRISKVISEDEITAVLRKPLVEVDEHGRRPRGHGFRWALGKLVLCPTCTGTWVAALLAYGLYLAPWVTRPLLAVMSASGAEQFGDAVLSLLYTDRDRLRRQGGES
jgi:hypothetical protein